MENPKDFRYLTESGLKGFVKALMKGFKVFGTVDKDGFPAFAEIAAPEDLVFSPTPTHLSAKEFLFAQREVLLRFNMKSGAHEPVVETRRQVLVGLHPCDLKALALMDRVFASGTPDVNYLARRKETLVIGASCTPDEYCFCKSLGNSEAEDGFDLFFHALDGGYLVQTGSAEGRALLSEHARTKAPTKRQLAEHAGRRAGRDASFVTSLVARPEELPSIYSRSDESPVWERIGAICTGCGSCNNVCPTCYCFDVKDEVKANLVDGERVRTWDGCTLEDFARVAGGHNFRRGRAERLRHRFNRKFRYLSDVFDSLFCVGCGRCSRACLVRINIAEVTNEISRECHAKK